MATLFEISREPQRIREGIVHLPGFLTPQQQHYLVTTARNLARAQAGTPFAMQQRKLKSGTMSAHLMSLGRHWNYERGLYVTQQDGHTVAPTPPELIDVARSVLTAAGSLDPALAAWVGEYKYEATLVNYYPPGSGMGMHQDLYEESKAPVISLSMGDSAIFRAGNVSDRNKPWDDILLASGDAIVFGGPARDIFHGVVRLDDNTAPEGCGLEKGRLNMTFRQVQL